MAKLDTEVEVSDRDIANAEKVPEWLRYSFLKAFGALQYGAAWGFVTAKEMQEEDFKAVEADLKREQGKTVLVTKLKNGCVLEFPVPVMKKVMHTIVPDVPVEEIDKKMADMQAIRKKDHDACVKFVNKLIENKVESEKKGGFSIVHFGLFCVNSSNNVSDEDINYKSFKLSVAEFFTILKQTKQPERFYISYKGSAPVQMSASIGKLIKIADSENGCVFDLCYKA